MRTVSPVLATAVLAATSLAALAAPLPAQEPAKADCLLTQLAATPQPSVATPAAIDAERPAWLSTTLTDVCSGAEFTLAQFSPEAVFVHPMATW